MTRTLHASLLVAGLLAAGCSDKESYDQVALDLTIWGGSEVGDGFVGDRETVDGWEIHFDSWISYFGNATVGDQGTGADSYYSIDWVRAPEPVALGSFEMDAGVFDLGFQVLPASTEAVNLTDVGDNIVALMIKSRWSHYIVGQAERSGDTIYFTWGIEITEGQIDAQEEAEAQDHVEAQITFHPDHLFFDWLDTEAAEMRFNVFNAWANVDDDIIEWDRLGEINAAAILDPYDEEMLDEEGHPLSYSNVGLGMDSFLTYSVRSAWHMNGQGLCEIDDPPPSR